MRQLSALSRLERASAHAIEEVDHILKFAPHNALRDKNNAGSFVAVWPSLQPGHRMEKVLRALNDRRSSWFFFDIDQSLDAKEAWTEILRNAVKQKSQLFSRQGIVSQQHKTLDAFFAKVVRMIVIMIMGAAVRIAMFVVLMICMALMSGQSQPRQRIGARVCGVEAWLGEELYDARRRTIDRVDLCRWVQSSEIRAQLSLHFNSIACDEIELRKQNVVCEGDLPDRLVVRLPRASPVHCVDQSNNIRHAIQAIKVGSERKACRMGPGSARPEVSITTFSNAGISPRCRE